MSHTELLLRANKLKYYVDVMATREVSPQIILAKTGLCVESLADSSCLVSCNQYEQVICNMLDASGTSSLGLEIGASATLADYGELSFAMMSAKNLREAASDWPKLCSLFGMFISYIFREESEGWSLVNIDCQSLKERAYIFAIEEFFLIHMRIAEALTGKHVVVEELAVPYAPPPHAALYEELFACKPRFNTPLAKLKVVAPHLDTPIRSYDPYLHDFIHRRCAQIIRQVSSQGAVLPRLRSLFFVRPGHFPTQAEAAEYLGMSTRSLRRKLQEEGGSFQGIIDTTRFELAHQYLVLEGLTAKQTAYLLGYQNVAAFRKSFKNWSEKTVGDYLKDFDRKEID